MCADVSYYALYGFVLFRYLLLILVTTYNINIMYRDSIHLV